MDTKIRKSLMLCVSLLLTLFIFGCTSETNGELNNENSEKDSNENSENNKMSDDDPDPVTLQVVVGWSDEMFHDRFKDPIEEEFPWITLEQVDSSSDKDALEDIFSEGLSPDIFFELSQENMERFELDYDLDELIKKHDYDVDHINPVYLDAMRAKDPDRRLLGIPYEIVNWVLFYNKEIFDAFGEDYPSNDMTWSGAVDLAKKLTRERDGVHYRGLDLGPVQAPLLQFSVNKTDPETGEVLLQEEEAFSRYLDLINDITDLDNSGEPFFDPEKFVEDRSTAMVVEFVQAVDWWSDAEGLDYDVAPLPTWDGEPAETHRPDEGILHLSISPHSEHKDAAFKVLTYFTEKEYQIFASQIGLGPTSMEDDVLEEFFQNYESTHDKNMQSIFTNPPASPPEHISRWDSYVDLQIHRYINGGDGDKDYRGLDRNEYLRIVTEESEAKIKNAMESE